MKNITLQRVSVLDPWLKAIARNYEIPQLSHVFTGDGLVGERVAFFIGTDGGGFGAIDSDLKGYISLSKAFANSDAGRIAWELACHPGIDEWVFDPGTFDYAATKLVMDASLELS